MSVSDLSGRFELPRTGRLHRLLSNRASTDCWSIRFSLRMMTSGALRSTSFLSRLFRLMIRRYRSFRSLVAKLPESNRTSGRRSGGMTGMHSRTIHSGLLLESRRASMIFSRLTKSRCFCLDALSFRSERAQVRRDDRDALQDHPLRLVAGVPEGLDDLQPLDEVPLLLLGRLVLPI